MKMYEEYKDSGVKWIGEVPSHWKIAPIKRFLSGMQDGTHGTIKQLIVVILCYQPRMFLIQDYV